MRFFGVKIFSLRSAAAILFATCLDIIVFLRKQVFFRQKVLSEYFFLPISETEISFLSNLLTENFSQKTYLAPSKLNGRSLNYIYFRGTYLSVHLFRVICEEKQFAYETLKSYLIHNCICWSSTPNYSFCRYLSKYSKIYEWQLLTAIKKCVSTCPLIFGVDFRNVVDNKVTSLYAKYPISG